MQTISVYYILGHNALSNYTCDHGYGKCRNFANCKAKDFICDPYMSRNIPKTISKYLVFPLVSF